jgi:hypothetical protein
LRETVVILTCQSGRRKQKGNQKTNEYLNSHAETPLSPPSLRRLRNWHLGNSHHDVYFTTPPATTSPHPLRNTSGSHPPPPASSR